MDNYGEFLIGLGIGFVIGVLIAPSAGTDTRERIGRKASEGADYLRQCGSELVEQAKQTVGVGQGQGSGTADAGLGR